MSPAFRLRLPTGFYLRSLTVNPVVGEVEDGASTRYRTLLSTLLLAVGYGRPKGIRPIIWIEFQIGAISSVATPVPDLRFELSPALRDALLSDPRGYRHELSRGLALVNAVTHEAHPAELQAAFGRGASAVRKSGQSQSGGQACLAMRRPFYRLESTDAPSVCFFHVGICERLPAPQDGELVVRPIPIHARSRCPVPERLSFAAGETISLWIPFLYPRELTNLTLDERRYLNLEILWDQRSSRPAELLSFPRIARRFRLVHSTPDFRASPRLHAEPAPWDTGPDGTFALDATLMTEQRSKERACGFALTFEDVQTTRSLLLAQILVSILVGVISGTFASLATENLSGLVLAHRVAGVVAALVLGVGSLFVLLPRGRSRRRISGGT